MSAEAQRPSGCREERRAAETRPAPECPAMPEDAGGNARTGTKRSGKSETDRCGDRCVRRGGQDGGPDRGPAAGAVAAGDAAPAFDLVLAVGPGRSGTTFLYRSLNAHPGFCAPEIKEAHCYRSARRLERALGDLRGSGAVLLDVSDTAWSDPRLGRVRALVAGGVRILVVVLLRRHRDRARSVIAYRRSRVLPALPALLPGGGGLERAAERDALTPAALERILALGADVLIVDFEALAARPGSVLDAIAQLCGVRPFGDVDATAANRAAAARSVPLAAMAKLAAVALRALGARRTLQALKDDPRVVGAVFRPLDRAEMPALSAAAAARLDRLEAECRAAVAAAGEPLGEGIWLARGAAR